MRFFQICRKATSCITDEVPAFAAPASLLYSGEAAGTLASLYFLSFL